MLDVSYIEVEDQITEEQFSNMNLPNVFYMKIEQVPYFLNVIAPKVSEPFCMVTHCGDLPVTESLFTAAASFPLMVRWYGQNIDCPPNPRLQSIPIGLENDFHNPTVHKRHKLRDAARNSFFDVPSKLAYMNFSFWTSRVYRLECFNCLHEKSWVTNDCHEAVKQDQYDHWISQVRDHHYVICPRGNGIDTHRLWETLYLGRIPVVLKCPNTKYYEDLPILQVNSWNELNETYLRDRIDYFSNSNNFNMNKLKFSWWKTFIEDRRNV